MDCSADIILSTNVKKCGFSSLIRSLLTEEDAIGLFTTFKLILFQRPNCICQSVCIKVKDFSMKIGFKWSCVNKVCGRSYNPLQNTVLENCHITFKQVAEVLIHWFFRQCYELTAVDCQISEPTIAHWYKVFRRVCRDANERSSLKIGGDGKWVEVDEAHLFKRKYHRGRPVKGESIWLFGGICRETKERFVVRVPNRTKRTLWQVLRKFVARGSILVTDGFKSYIGVKEALGFSAHEVVIHKDGFVDDLFREVFTNNIECLWSKIKKKIRNSGSNDNVDLHIAEFLYRTRLDQKFGRKFTYGIKLQTFLQDLRSSFPGRRK